jgi:hypothetical protein
MSSNKVTFTVDAEHSKAIAAFLEVSNAIKQSGAAGQQTGQQIAGGAQQANSAWSRGLNVLGNYASALAGMATGAMAVRAAAHQAVAEFERMKSVRASAYEATREGMPAYQRAGYSFTPEYASSKEFEKLSKEGIPARGTANYGDYFAVLASMASARGMVSEPDTHRAANVVAKIAGQKGLEAEETEDLGGAIMDLMNTQIFNGKKPDAKELVGGVYSGFGATRSTKIGQFAQYDMRAIQTLTREYGFSFPQAVGLQSAVGGALPDPTGRRASTVTQSLPEDLTKAYAAVSELGAGRPGIPVEKFKTLGMKMFDVVSADDTTGMLMRTYLEGLRSDDAKTRSWSSMFGRGNMGKMEGEKGGFEVKKDLLRKNSVNMARARKAAAEVKEGPEAVQVYEDAVQGPLRTPQQVAAAEFASQEGIKAALKFQNVTKARQGGINKLVEDLGTITGTGDLQQKLRDFMTALESSDKSGPEIDRMQIEALDDATHDIRVEATHRLYGKGKGYLEWARQKYGKPAPLPPQQFGSEFGGAPPAADYEPYPPAVRQEWVEKNFTPEEKMMVELLEKSKQTTRENMNRTRAGAMPAQRPSFPELKQWRATHWKAAESDSAAELRYQRDLQVFESGRSANPSTDLGPSNIQPFKMPTKPRHENERGLIDVERRKKAEQLQGESLEQNARIERVEQNAPAERVERRQKAEQSQRESLEQNAPVEKQPAPYVPSLRPDDGDQSTRQLIDSVRELVSAIRDSGGSRELQIAVDDKSGRPLQRATSRPRAIELFYDDVVG